MLNSDVRGRKAANFCRVSYCNSRPGPFCARLTIAVPWFTPNRRRSITSPLTRICGAHSALVHYPCRQIKIPASPVRPVAFTAHRRDCTKSFGPRPLLALQLKPKSLASFPTSAVRPRFSIPIPHIRRIRMSERPFVYQLSALGRESHHYHMEARKTDPRQPNRRARRLTELRAMSQSSTYRSSLPIPPLSPLREPMKTTPLTARQVSSKKPSAPIILNDAAELL